MSSTTIRIDAETHARLQKLSKETGQTLIETVRDAAEALGRQHFAYRVANELASLRADTTSWKDYLAEADSTSVADGIG